MHTIINRNIHVVEVTIAPCAGKLEHEIMESFEFSEDERYLIKTLLACNSSDEDAKPVRVQFARFGDFGFEAGTYFDGYKVILTRTRGIISTPRVAARLALAFRDGLRLPEETTRPFVEIISSYENVGGVFISGFGTPRSTLEIRACEHSRYNLYLKQHYAGSCHEYITPQECVAFQLRY